MHYSEELLTAMADAGGGSASWASGPEDAPEVFASELEEAASIAARDVSVEIVPQAPVRLDAVMGEHRREPGGWEQRVVLGDVHRVGRRLVVCLDLPPLPAGRRRLGRVLVRHTPLGEDIPRLTEVALEVEVTAPAVAAAAGADLDVLAEAALLRSAGVEREASRAAERGEFDIAERRLRECVEQLRELAIDSPRAAELLARADRLEEAVRLVDREHRMRWGLMEKKRLHYTSQDVWRGKPQRDWKGGF
jgi:hypothetical protein